MHDQDFDEASRKHSDRKEPSYKKRRRSDLHPFNVAVEPQSYVDAKALARLRKKSTGEFIDDLIKAEVAREVEKQRAA